MKKTLTKKTEIKKLYHISLETPTELTPRVPKYRLKTEDAVTPRISVCPTIEDCFKSAPWSVSYYDKGKYDGEDRELVRVLEFDVENIGLDNIIDNDYIVKNNLVPDALDTNEFWIVNKQVKPDSVYYIYPREMDYAYLMDHTYIGLELYSYFKISEGAISENTISFYKGTMYPWELGLDEKDITLVEVTKCSQVF